MNSHISIRALVKHINLRHPRDWKYKTMVFDLCAGEMIVILIRKCLQYAAG
jgi:hypothetical protein